MLLSVIIVSYNTKDLTLQTLKSVASGILNSKLLKKETEIIIVDNNSVDDSIKSIKKFKQENKVPIKIIAQKENLGFGKANNAGIDKSKGKYILLLNSDTIVRKNALEIMVKHFEDYTNEQQSIEKLGILSATLLNADLSLQPQGGSFPNLISLFFHMSMIDDLPIIGKFFPTTQDTGRNTKQTLEYEQKNTRNNKKISRHEQKFLKNNKQTSKQEQKSIRNSRHVFNHEQKNLKNNELIKMDWVSGTAMMIPRSVLDEIDYLDPNIFMYGEDIEICIRANNHHYQVAIDPTAQIIHLKNQSSSSQNAIRGEIKGYLYIFAKHQNQFKLELAKIILQMGALIRIFLFSTIAKNKYKKTIYSNVLKDLNK